MRSVVSPTGVERRFPSSEIIVSKTDSKGRITYVNDVFLEVSGFDEAELLGEPHNVIRHPQMPRCVFDLMWERIGAGREVFVYVQNMCADGAHYWVFAHVTPSFDDAGRLTGFHSNRRSADPAAVAVARGVYEQLLEEESRFDRRQDAVVAGRLLLDSLTGPVGGYDSWVWSLEPEDVA